jgi:hypothetical protein
LPSTGGAQATSAAGTTPSEPVDADDATLAAAVAMLAASMPAPSDAVLPSQDFFEHREAAPGTPPEQVTVAALSRSDSSAEPANGSEAAQNEAEGADDGAPLRALEALSEEELLALFS